MKVGILQLNPLVGDLHGNAVKIVDAARRARDLGADFCVSCELAVLGYPPRDMLLYENTLAMTLEAVQAVADQLDGVIPLLLGGVEPNPGERGKPCFNAAFWLENGIIGRTFHKSLLPTYDVFDEARYFEPGETDDDGGQRHLLEWNGRRIAVTICEDAWTDKDFWPHPNYHYDPLEKVGPLRPDVIVNLSASPFSLGKQRLRERMLGAIAAKYAIPMVYVNQVGGDDDLIFDGRSCSFGPDGGLIARSPGFVEDVAVVDLGTGASGNAVAQEDDTAPAETYQALLLGTRDYVNKSKFRSVLLGLSGGIDSAVTAAVAAHAVGPENVLGVLMPSPYSSAGSVDDSVELVKRLGIKSLTLAIEPVMQAFERTLSEPFAGRAPDTTEENIQSRIRGNLLMALSNKYGALLLTTGNKSELAVGYCTIYGDMSGGYAVISDVPKCGVYALANWMNERFGEIVPEPIITKAPSAELRPDQKDEDSLPPYEILDEILQRHIESHQSAAEIVSAGFDEDTVYRVLHLVKTAEFKRRQAAPGIKISERSFGTGWRMPLACRRLL